MVSPITPIGRMGLFCTVEITFSYIPVFSKTLFNLALKNVSAFIGYFLPNILREYFFCLMPVVLRGRLFLQETPDSVPRQELSVDVKQNERKNTALKENLETQKGKKR